ncbi:hypothetical protein C0991_005896 [Blastosporella zonata]|nr:hypothetical protein C0991_005896 [Blastosporella zonata]
MHHNLLTTYTFLADARRSYHTKSCQNSRTEARSLILEVLETDIVDVTSTIKGVADALAQHLHPGKVKTSKPPKFRSLSIHTSMWKKLYTTVDDAKGIATLINLVAQSCHIDALNLKHFSHIAKSISIDGSQTAEAALEEVNRALDVFRDGFLPSMTGYAYFNTSSAALDLLLRPGVAKNLMMISLPPMEDLQLGAQALVGLAFDVDARQECFRALLENIPKEALNGILDFLTTFKNYAPVMPEACNLSKSLVRCFTDILDVLSATPNGLLHSTRFLNPQDDSGPSAALFNMWKLMTKSFSVILKCTPTWATYFETAEMVVWMRDALIFGRVMLATWRVIEKAANFREATAVRDTRRLSPIGKQMANGLQEVLLELSRWLGLTDEELLHQSFALLTSLLASFNDAWLSPHDETTKKLRRFIDSARQKKDDPRQWNSRLDPTRLLTLEAALDEFEDVVEIVPPPAPAPAPHVAPKANVLPVPTKEKKKEKVQRSLTSLKKPQYIKDRDQQKIQADIVVPTFRKSSTAVVPAKPAVGPFPSSTSGPQFDEASVPQTASSSSDSESESESEDEEQSEMPCKNVSRARMKSATPPFDSIPTSGIFIGQH